MPCSHLLVSQLLKRPRAHSAFSPSHHSARSSVPPAFSSFPPSVLHAPEPAGPSSGALPSSWAAHGQEGPLSPACSQSAHSKWEAQGKSVLTKKRAGGKGAQLTASFLPDGVSSPPPLSSSSVPQPPASSGGSPVSASPSPEGRRIQPVPGAEGCVFPSGSLVHAVTVGVIHLDTRMGSEQKGRQHIFGNRDYPMQAEAEVQEGKTSSLQLQRIYLEKNSTPLL